MKTKYLLLFILLCFTSAAKGQAGLFVKGVVKDYKTGDGLSGANQVLKAGNKILYRAVTGKDGRFSFQNTKTGEYLLITSYLGFKADTQHAWIKNDTTILIFLKRTNVQLAEVKVKSAIAPITLKGDTVVFNAQAYKTRPFATVDELLKMLPGVTIDKDGNVTMNGDKIDKILIDGKSFFIDDLRKATKLFPAEIVSKIEIYRSQSQEADQAGITNYIGSTKTINLKIKDDKKNSMFGKAYAGAGNNHAYAAGGNVTRLNGKQLLSVQASSNNISNQFTGTEDIQGNTTAGKQLLNTFGVNYSNEFSKKLTVTAYVDYSISHSCLLNSNSRQTFLGDSTLISSNQNNMSGRQNNLTSTIDLQYKPTDRIAIFYNFSQQSSHNSQSTRDTTVLNVQKAGTAYLSSNGFTGNTSEQNGSSFSNRLIFTQRFLKKGRSMIVSLHQSSAKQQVPTGIKTEVETYNPVNDQIVDQQVINPVKNESYSANIQYQEPVGEKLNLGVNYALNDNYSKIIKTADNFDPVTRQYDLTDTLNSNSFVAKMLTQMINLTLQNGSRQFHYFFGIGEQAYNQANNNITRLTQSSHTYYNLLPSVNLGVVMKNGRSVDFTYQGHSQAPAIDQLQPIADLSNPYLQKIGNPDLQQAYAHIIRGTYSVFKPGSLTNYQLNFQANITQHQITLATTTLPGGIQQMQYVNLNGVYHFTGGQSFGFPLLNQGNGTGTLQTNLTYGHDRSIINGQENTTQSKGLSALLVLNYHHGNKLFITLESTTEYQTNQYSVPDVAGNATFMQSSNLSVTYSLPFLINAGGEYNLRYNKTGISPAQHSGILTAFLSKSLWKDQSLQLRLSGFNLLDTKSSISQNVGTNYIEITKTNTLHRLVLCSLIYNFITAAKGG